MRLFVYGQEEHVHNDVELQRMLDDDDNESKVSSSEVGASRYKSLLLLLYCFTGLQLSYLIWGILQEKIMTTEYIVYTSPIGM